MAKGLKDGVIYPRLQEFIDIALVGKPNCWFVTTLPSPLDAMIAKILVIANQEALLQLKSCVVTITHYLTFFCYGFNCQIS